MSDVKISNTKKVDRKLKWLLIRHGESTWNESGRIQGWSNPHLSETGRKQAERLAARLKRTKISHLYTSPLRRARQTATAVAEATGLKACPVEELKEICLGDWEGLTPFQVDRQFSNGYASWLKDPHSVRIPNAEGSRPFVQRISRAFQRLRQETSEGTVAVVTHGGVIAAYLSSLLGSDFDRTLLSIQLDNTGLTTLEWINGHPSVRGVNDHRHLGGNVAARGWHAQAVRTGKSG
ncbi:MAG: histidine phosphatase family protein [Candidatus Omnitrophica bacterium]|nr:histidine phosphatase family protein [Candidatus Omnitrophota bacterium]